MHDIDHFMERLKEIRDRRHSMEGGEWTEVENHKDADAALVDFIAHAFPEADEFRSLWDSIDKWYD